MKKLLSILLLATSLVFGQNISGTGTYADPYKLYDAADLDSIRLYLYNNTNTAGIRAFSLQNDVDMSGTTFMDGRQLWTGLAISEQDTFVFNGNGYTISNMTCAWDTVTHPVDGKTLKAGFIAHYALHSNSGSTYQDTIKNIVFYNTIIRFDSTENGVQSGPLAETCAGTLIGQLDEGGFNGEGLVIENIFIRKAEIRFNVTGTAWINQGIAIGGLIGGVTNMGDLNFETLVTNVGMDSVHVYAYYGRIAAYCYTGGFLGRAEGGAYMIFNNCFLSNAYVQFDAASAYWEFAGDTESSTFLAASAGPIKYYNCYVYNATLRGTGILGGSSDTEDQGSFAAQFNQSTGIIDNCYVGKFTGIKDNPTSQAPDNHGWWISRAGTTLMDSTNIIDTTGFAASTYYAMYGQENATPTSPVKQASQTQMQTLSTFTDEGWDFASVWARDANIQDNYPYLQWAYEYLVSTSINLNNPTGGETFEQDSIVTVHWTINPGPAQYVIGDYSIDGGSSWSRIDSVNIADTSMTWSVPQDIYTTTGMVRVYTDVTSGRDSSSIFTILPHAVIDFIYPIEEEDQSFFVGDTAHLVLETIFVENFLLYWSKDSTNWTFLDSVEVDTTNGFVLDTTVYIWTFDAEIKGPDIYGRATAVGDTNLYVFEEQIAAFDPGLPVGLNICQYDDGGYALEHYYHYDPSCGWANPPHVYYTRLIPDDGIGPSWTWLSETFSAPYTGATHPSTDFAYVVSGSDTLPVPWTSLYPAEEWATTVTYKQRLYFIDASDTTLRCNDLRNGIDSIFVADIGASWFGGTLACRWSNVEDLRLTVYNIQRSKLIGQYVQDNIDYETLNDPDFEPKIIINEANTACDRWYMSVSALATPIDPLFPSDDELLFVNASIGRFYFRGIHPKAEKR